MFSSQYTYTLDPKGRLILPARWRKELGTSVVVTRGLDPCLFVFPGKRFETLANELEQLGLAQSDARALSRHFFAEAIDNALDRRGRLALTPALMDFAGISGEAVVIGANDRIEIWNPQRYADMDAKTEAEVSAVAERLGQALQNVK